MRHYNFYRLPEGRAKLTRITHVTNIDNDKSVYISGHLYIQCFRRIHIPKDKQHTISLDPPADKVANDDQNRQKR